jgi:hypothetical protein
MNFHPFKKYQKPISVVQQLWLIILVIAGMTILSGCSGRPENAADTNSVAIIFPDYYDLIIPPNIAPLNFVIRESGSKFRIEISGNSGKTIAISQKSPSVRIPLKKWQKILSENTGKNIKIDIWSYHNSKWNKYKTIIHQISADPIDPYLAYRLVHAVYLKWDKMGIYQRNLTNFSESVVIENSAIDNGCMNCHSFSNNDPSKMLIHFRILHPGTLIWNDGKLSKVNTATAGTLSAGIYPAWHPDGNHIAFSTGKISPHLTTHQTKVVDVADRESDLMVYDVAKNLVVPIPKDSINRRENMPVWSADGKMLYFTSAPEAVKGDDESLLLSKYDLMRIAFNTKNNSWGEPEMVLSSAETGMSISMPRISPDGKYMICSMADFGYFTIFARESDLYLINLETREYRKLEINSNSAESHSSWSSNGRWLVFSSKRGDDVFSRPYIAWFDTNGVAHTPFLLPQKDPKMYSHILANYNLPVLLTGKIDLSPLEIRDKVYSEAENVELK